MYAFNTDLQSAWQTLFDQFLNQSNYSLDIDKVLRFETDDATIHDPNLLIGQTCGYPLIKFYKEHLVPLCVPVFDVEGCEDIRYRSAIIAAAGSTINSIEDCVGKSVVINGPDSNSGMNMLRDRVAQLTDSRPYFASTITSGSHLNSITDVAEKRADVAAIDCVTFALAQNDHKKLLNRVKVIGYTDTSTALPFVVSRENASLVDQQHIIDQMNTALASLPQKSRSLLPIVEFQSVSLDDYDSIAEMEASALARKHSALDM